MRTNKDKLPCLSVSASVSHPRLSLPGYWVGTQGKGRIMMGPGGICYSHKIGDNCMDIAGDHIEPGVSLKNPDDKANGAFHTFSCIGNTVEILSGNAKGKTGVITGFHGGVDHTMAYFDEEIINQLTPNDTFFVKARGQGLQLLDYPDIQVMNMEPEFLEKLDIKEENGKLNVAVTHNIPAFLMGAGIGETTLMSGDYDIMTQDPQAVSEYHLDTLRFGDIICIEDHNAYNGAQYKKGSKSIGVIVHSDSFTNGHGPGVAVFLTTDKDSITTTIKEDANLIKYIK